jgi:hypothetical protein
MPCDSDQAAARTAGIWTLCNCIYQVWNVCSKRFHCWHTEIQVLLYLDTRRTAVKITCSVMISVCSEFTLPVCAVSMSYGSAFLPFNLWFLDFILMSFKKLFPSVEISVVWHMTCVFYAFPIETGTRVSLAFEVTGQTGFPLDNASGFYFLDTIHGSLWCFMFIIISVSALLPFPHAHEDDIFKSSHESTSS